MVPPVAVFPGGTVVAVQIAPSSLEQVQRGFRVGPPGGPSGPSYPSAGPRRRPRRFGSLLVLMIVVAGAGSAGVLVAAKQQVDRIERIAGLDSALSPADPNVENFLLVGSDSREGADPSDPDYGGIGEVLGSNRSDTVMVLRLDKSGGPAALLSLPRDLWVDIPGRGDQRINVAYQDGPATLIETVQGLGIPVHHYVEIDFQGFKALVDAIGGVTIAFFYPGRDTHTGFYVPTGGDHVLDGVQALAYARSRYYEDFVNGQWVGEAGLPDIKRIGRQQGFIDVALKSAIAKVKGNPLAAGDVLMSMTAAVKLDGGLDVLGAAGALREAVAAGLQTFTPPVYGTTIDGNSVLLLGDGAAATFDYFSGASNTPPVAA